MISARKITNARPQGICKQFIAGDPAKDSDVVMRAGMDAVQAECAIHISNLAGLEQRQLATANRNQVRHWFAPAADAVLGMAGNAHILFPNLHLERGERGRHKIELSDRANEFAERKKKKKTIYDKHGEEVSDDQPCGPPRRGPQVEQFVSKKNQREENDREPLVAERARPVEPRLKKATRRLAHQHERASQAEEISRPQQDQHQHSAKMKPAESRCQVLRR